MHLTLLQAGGQDSTSMLLMFGMIAVVFYFFMIRPQARKAKKAKKFKEALKKGDKIVTIGGIHGKVTEIRDTNVLIETENGRLRIEKTAISVEMSTGAASNAEAEMQQANR